MHAHECLDPSSHKVFCYSYCIQVSARARSQQGRRICGISKHLPDADPPVAMAMEHALCISPVGPAIPEFVQGEGLIRNPDERRRTLFIWSAGPPLSDTTKRYASLPDRRSFPRPWSRFDDGDGDPITPFLYPGLAVKRPPPRYACLPPSIPLPSDPIQQLRINGTSHRKRRRS
jgi:hypothetical protein